MNRLHRSLLPRLAWAILDDGGWPSLSSMVPRLAWSVLVSLPTIGACSSAHLDPNTRAVTFYSPTREAMPAAGAGGAQGLKKRGASRSPQSGASVAGQPPIVENAAGTAGSAGEGPWQPSCASLPDPTPSRTDQWVELSVRFDKGALEITSAKPQRSRRAETTPRRMGRFALELWIGCELIDRVRFDFPLLSADPARDRASDPLFEAAAHFDTKILVPDSGRATRLELIDRARQSRKIIDWPMRR